MRKKAENCDRNDIADRDFGDRWDHTAVDPEQALLLALVPGARTAANSRAIVEQVHARTGGRTDLLLASDEHAPYKAAIRAVYGVETSAPKKPGHPPKPRKAVPASMCYATVRKTREKGRVTKVVRKLIFGEKRVLAALLQRSSASTTINTSFVERHNATDRGQNARKRRKTYCFSKSRRMHDAVSYLVAYSYNFCWPVRTLRARLDTHGPCTPAMAAGLAEHVWSLREWALRPATRC